MNSREILKRAAGELRKAGVPDPETDSAELLSRVTGRPALALRLETDRGPTEEQETEFRGLMARRLRREPLQYILGTAAFCGLEFLTVPGTLIPRPETELLAEWAAERMAGRPEPEILDLCCGGGCLGISLRRMLPDSRVTLSDLSPEAVRLAAKNRERLEAECEILQGDLFETVDGRRFDCIVCNPPYIPSEECGRLQEEVMREPHLALDGGEDGLAFYRRIAAEAIPHLKENGVVLLETGAGEAEAAAGFMERGGAVRTEIRPDLNGIARMVLAEYR